MLVNYKFEKYLESPVVDATEDVDDVDPMREVVLTVAMIVPVVFVGGVEDDVMEVVLYNMRERT